MITKELKTALLTTVAVGSLPSLSGCSHPEIDPAVPMDARVEMRRKSIRNMGEGIFVMDNIDSISPEVQAERLVTFLKDHPELRITAFGPGTGGGQFRSLIIVTEAK